MVAELGGAVSGREKRGEWKLGYWVRAEGRGGKRRSRWMRELGQVFPGAIVGSGITSNDMLNRIVLLGIPLCQ